MSHEKSFAEAIRRVGTKVILNREEMLEFYASLQPVNPGDEQPSNLGWGSGKRFRMYTAVSGDGADLTRGDEVICRGERYLVRWAQPRYLKQEKVYILAGLVMRGDAI